MASRLDSLMEPLSRCLADESARRLVSFHIDPSLAVRLETLAERANECILTAGERSEYEAFINAADFVAILKSKARRHLDQIEG